jgi:general secretion pathway protein G
MHSKSANRPRHAGFTLIEVLIVVVILGVLAGVVVVNVMDNPDKAKVVAAKSDISSITGALKIYRLDKGSYPPSGELKLLSPKYVERLSNDPWGNPYQYLNPGVHGEIDVFSYGADGKPGGEGFNTDVGSWGS